MGDRGRAPEQVAPHNKATGELDVKDCILLFGAFCNGELFFVANSGESSVLVGMMRSMRCSREI